MKKSNNLRWNLTIGGAINLGLVFTFLLMLILFFLLLSPQPERIEHENYLVKYIDVAGKERQQVMFLPADLQSIEVVSGKGVYWMEVVDKQGWSHKAKHGVIDVLGWKKLSKQEMQDYYNSK